MKRDHSLTIPPVGTIDAFALDGAPELFHVDSVELGVVNLTRVSTNTQRRTGFEAALLKRRPRDVEAWRPLIMRDYTMDAEGRAALIAEVKPATRTVEEDMAWVDSLEHGPYTPMGPICHNGEDLARAFPSLTSAVKDGLKRDLYATIGDPVPPLVWPRQETSVGPESSPASPPWSRATITLRPSADGVIAEAAGVGLSVVTARGDTHADALANLCGEIEAQAPATPRKFRAGDKVLIARKVKRDSKGRSCGWGAESMDPLVGSTATVLSAYSDADDVLPIYADANGVKRWYSPEALDLIEPAPE